MDTGLSAHPSLEGLWADVSQSAEAPLAVVVGFNVFKHGFTHLDAANEAHAWMHSTFRLWKKLSAQALS